LTLQERLEQAETKATAAVEPMTDEELRAVARLAIVRHLMVGHVKYLRERENQVTLAVPAVLAALSALSLFMTWGFWISFAFAAGIHLSTLLLLGMVGLHSDGRKDLFASLPHRLPALIAGILALGALIMSFANMYIATGEICPAGLCSAAAKDAGSPPSLSEETKPHKLVSKLAPHPLTDPLEALYFSTVTILTLGYGDFVPTDDWSRALVLWQLMSGGTLLLLLIPVVMSRVASYATYS
jgi:hypothetical protein